jgi:hypothetical protein
VAAIFGPPISASQVFRVTDSLGHWALGFCVMKKANVGRILVGVLVAVSLLVVAAQAAPTTQQKTRAKVVEASLKKATNLSKARKFKEAAEALKQAQKQMT